MDFTLMYFDEIMPELLLKMVRQPGPGRGYFLCRYDNPTEAALAIGWLRDSVLPELEDVVAAGKTR